MAKQTHTYDSIMNDLKAGKFKPIYILMGEEPYYIDKVSDYIENHALAPEERDFNQTVVYGVDTSPAQVVDMAKRFPMMAERQVIIVKEAQNIKNWDRLDAYLEKPLMSTVLVLCYKFGTIDARKKFLAKAETIGVVLRSEKIKERELPAFIEQYAASQNATIEPKAKAMIADFIGVDLSRIVSEIDKTLISMDDNKRVITPEIVEAKIGISKDFNFFELRNALVEKDVVKANRIVKYIDSNPKSVSLFSFLPPLFTFFQNLMVAHYTDRTDRGVMQALGYKSPYAVMDYMKAMRMYNASKTMKIIHEIRVTDAKSKGVDNPNTTPGDLLKQLVYFILH